MKIKVNLLVPLAFFGVTLAFSAAADCQPERPCLVRGLSGWFHSGSDGCGIEASTRKMEQWGWHQPSAVGITSDLEIQLH